MLKNLQLYRFITACLMIVFVIVLRILYPSETGWMPEGFKSPIIAFEFLQSNHETFLFLKLADRDAFLMGNTIDNGFLMIYSIFLALWIGIVYGDSSRWNRIILILLCLLVGTADFIENYAMDQLIYCYDIIMNPEEFENPLHLLTLSTSLKWFLLNLIIGLIFLKINFRSFYKYSFILLACISFSLFLMMYTIEISYATPFTLLISIQFLILIILTFVDWFSKESDPEVS